MPFLNLDNMIDFQDYGVTALDIPLQPQVAYSIAIRAQLNQKTETQIMH